MAAKQCCHSESPEGVSRVEYQDLASLFTLAQIGCPASLETLIRRHRGLVHAAVHRQWLGNLSYTEAVQAGFLGLWRAILCYDPSRGTAFSTYAWPAITRSVHREVARGRAPAEPVTQAYLNAPNRGEPETSLHQAEVHASLHGLVARMPPKLREVVVAYWGLDGEPPRSLRQLSRAFGISHEGVRQRLLAALVWLRHPAHSFNLRQLLDRNSVDAYRRAHHLAQTWRRSGKGGRRG